MFFFFNFQYIIDFFFFQLYSSVPNYMTFYVRKRYYKLFYKIVLNKWYRKDKLNN